MEKTRFKKPENLLPSVDEQKRTKGLVEQFKCKNCRWAFKMPTGGMPQVMLICHGAPADVQIVGGPQGPSVQIVPRAVPDDYFCKEFELLESLNG